MCRLIKHIFGKEKQQKDLVQKFLRPSNWEPKVYILQKDLPNVKRGVRFTQSYYSDNVYFCAISISSSIPEKDQVGIIEFEAKDVENSKWFKEEKK